MSRKMKDSGIEWIGEMPSNWKTLSIKNLLDEVKVMNKKSDVDFLLSLTIEKGIIPFNEKQSGGNKEKEDISKYKLAYKNNMVLNSMNVVVGAVGISKYDGIVSPVYYVLKEKKNISNINYFYRLFLCEPFQEVLKGLGNGIMSKITEESGKMNTIRKKIPMIKLNAVKVPVPNITEQTKIANFLDEKCSMVDKAIGENKKSIEKMEEYKKSIFNDLIDKIDVRYIKLKYLVKQKLQYGANEIGISYRQELPRYIRITDIGLDGTLKNNNKMSLNEEKARDFILNDSDVLFARSGATVGKTFIYKNEYGKSAFAGYLIRAIFINKEIAEYVYYYSNSSLYEEWKNSIFIQSTIQNIGADKYSEMLVPIPINIEIKNMLNTIKSKEIKIDAVIQKRKALIEKLEEYKKSLIYEAVTGKMEV